MASRKTNAKWVRTKADEIAIEQGCYFDTEAASFAIDFIETFCTLTKGRKAGNKISLLGWQRDLVARLFGWKRADGTRRFRSAYIEIPKKNGKSLLMSAIAIYMGVADGESGSEVYLAAVNSKQARIIFDECVKMIKSSPSLKKHLDIKDAAKTILHRASFSKITLVTADADSQDGFDSHCTIFDELHRQKTSKLWDVFEYAGKGREQPLLLSITTAGQDRGSVCWQEHERAIRIITGESLETTHLAIIYAASREDSLDDPATWHKANPSLGHTLRVDDFQRDLDKVRESPSGLNNFLRLRLNIWTQPETAYIAHHHWTKCGKMTREQWDDLLRSLEGKQCFAGIDISSKKDITAFVLLFPDNDGFIVVPYFWIPEVEAKERERNDGIPYTQWMQDGLITFTPGAGIDYDLIESQIVALSKTYRIKSVTSDDWGSSEAVCQRLVKHGLKVAYMKGDFKHISEPTKELERQAILGRLNHGCHPILTWMNENAVVKSDSMANVRLVKPNKDSPKKIDGLIALIEAFEGYTLASNKRPSNYTNRGVLTL